MKNLLKLSAFFCSLLLMSMVNAQTNQEYNPYESIGQKAEILTLSNGKYVEFFDLDSIEIIGDAILNTNTMKVIGFVERDTSYSEATLEPEIVSRWLSPDPLAIYFPDMSPYNAMANNPILFIDEDGAVVTLSKALLGNSKEIGNLFNNILGASTAIKIASSGEVIFKSAQTKANAIALISDFDAGRVTGPNIVARITLLRKILATENFDVNVATRNDLGFSPTPFVVSDGNGGFKVDQSAFNGLKTARAKPSSPKDLFPNAKLEQEERDFFNPARRQLLGILQNDATSSDKTKVTPTTVPRDPLAKPTILNRRQTNKLGRQRNKKQKSSRKRQRSFFKKKAKF